jgi:hypothetical protein
MKNIRNEFVPYELALKMKQLGFDEPCLARYNVPGDLITSGCYSDSSIMHLIVEENDICEAHILAPLYQQAFRWFREKYKFNHSIICHKHPFGTDDYQYLILLDEDEFVETGFNTYEEAELACLEKLIEIVEQSK